MKIEQALQLLRENHYVCNAAGHNGFELDYPSVEYYREQIKIELKKLGYNSVDWVDWECWTKLINDLYNDEKDVEDAADIIRDYENEEQMRAQEEKAQEKLTPTNYASGSAWRGSYLENLMERGVVKSWPEKHIVGEKAETQPRRRHRFSLGNGIFW